MKMTRMGQIDVSKTEQMMDVFSNSDLNVQKDSQEKNNQK